MSEELDTNAPAVKKTNAEKKLDKYGDDASKFSLKENSNIPAEGIYRDRGCTDIICLIVFLSFLGSMLGLTFYGFIEGNPRKLFYPFDKNGNVCGIDEGYEKFPKLMFPMEDGLKESLNGGWCVESCPDETIIGSSEYKVATTDSEGKGAMKSFDYIIKSKTYIKFCWPDSDDQTFKDDTDLYAQWTKTNTKYKQKMSNLEFMQDISMASTSVYIGFAMALINCLVFIKIMSMFAEYIAWSIVVVVQVGLVFGTGFCFYMYFAEPEGGYDLESKAINETKKYSLIVGIVFGIVSLVYAILIMCFKDSLKIAIDIIDAASDFLDNTIRIVGVPVGYFFIQIILVLIWTIQVGCINSIGEIKADFDPKNGLPQMKTITGSKDSNFYLYANLFMFFGLLWIINWIKAKTQFIAMVAASTYYFNSSKEKGEGSAEVMTAFHFCYKYHSGSLAFGSFIIALIQFIKFIFLYMAQKAETMSGENTMVKCIVKIGGCLIQCIEKICDYINKAAYSYMAVSGDGFCTSAWNGFLLNMKHSMKFAFANFLASMFIFLGKLSVVFFNLVCVYFIMKADGDMDKVNSATGPLVLVGIVSFMCATIFLGLFDETVIALVTCVAVDSDLNDGEPQYGPPTFHDHLDKIGGDFQDPRMNSHYSKKNEIN